MFKVLLLYPDILNFTLEINFLHFTTTGPKCELKLGRFVYSISYFDHLRMYLRIHQNNTVQNSDNLYHSVQATSNWTRLHHIWYHPRDWQLGIFLSHLEFEIHLFTLTCLLNALVFYKSIKDFLLYYFPFFDVIIRYIIF